MVQESNIEWCTHTSNPVKFREPDGRVVWGCVKVSAGCANCYAEALSTRYGRGGPFTKPVMRWLTPFVDEKELRELLSPKRLPAGSMCFVGDMTDVFGEWVTDEMLDRLFAVFALRGDVVFQVLTKRPERLRAYLLGGWSGYRQREVMHELSGELVVEAEYPLPNVWLGTSVEDQRAADERIPELLATPAAVRYLSCEPLLGPVDLRLDEEVLCGPGPDDSRKSRVGRDGLHWVIVGGESGTGARAMDLDWMRGIVRHCHGARVPVFVKQLGSKPDGLPPVRNRRKGDAAWRAIETWPEDLRVRQWPEAVYA